MKKVTSVFIIVAAVVMLLYSNDVIVEAAERNNYTVDDLRELVGMERHRTQKYALEVVELADKLGAFESREEFDKLLERIELSKVVNTGYDAVAADLENAKAYLKNAIETGLSAEVVFQAINQVEYFNNMESKYYTSNINVEYKHGEETDYGVFENRESVIEFIENFEEEYTADPFIVGVIGKGLRPYTENLWNLSCAFGEYKENGADKMSNKIKTLNSLKNSINIISQLHGSIESIEKDSDTTYEIVVSHGKYVKTIYGGVSDIEVEIGQKVKQYEKLGVLESNKESSLQVLVDDSIVNPLLLYGADGIHAFYELAAKSPDKTFDDKFVNDVKDEPSELVEAEEKNIVKLDESTGYINDDRVTFGGGFIDNNR